MGAHLGAVLAAVRACIRLMFVAAALLFLAAAAAPVAAQQPGSVNPNADAVKEQQLLQQGDAPAGQGGRNDGPALPGVLHEVGVELGRR